MGAIPLLTGFAASFYIAKDFADGAWQAYEKPGCAHRYIASKVAQASASKSKSSSTAIIDDPTSWDPTSWVSKQMGGR